MAKIATYTEEQALRDIEHVVSDFKKSLRSLENRRADLLKRIARRKDNEDTERVRRGIKKI